MGLFRNTKEAAEEKAFEGATDWFKEQVQTAKAYNEEDGKMGGQDTPKQARIFLAIEDNEKEGWSQHPSRQTTRRFSSTLYSRWHCTRMHSRSSSLQQQPS